jgi:type 1 fimbria pilin
MTLFKIIISFGVVISAESHAVRCSLFPQNGAFQISPINVPANTPAWSFLSRWIATSQRVTHTQCTTERGDTRFFTYLAKVPNNAIGVMVDGGSSYVIFATPVAGVGYIIKGGFGSSHDIPMTLGDVDMQLIEPSYNTGSFSFEIRFVSTRVVVTASSIQPFTVVQTGVKECSAPGTCYPNTSSQYVGWTNQPISLTTRTCSVTTRTLIFSLPPARQNDMPNIGSTGGSLTQNLQLNCPAGSNLQMVITDQTMPANRGSILTLAADSGASGFGIEVLHNGKPVLFGPDSASVGAENQFSIGNNLSGFVSIPLTARYIRTSLTSRAGSVKALATFTMSYQ